MKKLLIAVTVLAVGASAFGATVDWNFDAEDQGTFGNATYYAINGDASSYISALNNSGYDAFIALINNATEGTGGDYTTGTLNEFGGSGDQYFSPAANEMAVIVFDNGTGAGKEYAYVTGIDTTSYQYEGGQQGVPLEIYAYTEQGDFDMSRGRVAQPVPEPTSVALLALGLAALGLKRKVA